MGRSGPECRWWRGRRAHPATCRVQVRMEGCGGEWFGVPVPRLFLFVGALHPIRRQCTSSVRVHRHVTGAPPRNGCSAPHRVQRPRACGGCGGCRGCGGLLGLSCLLLGALRGASCCGSSEMSHVIPRHVFQTLKSHRWNCNVLGCCRKFGHPNYVRVLVDEAPKANSCVRSSSHDTVHNPRDASNTTPTPHNAKSRFASWRARHATQRGAASSRMRTRRAPASSMTVTRRAIQRRSTPASHAARMGFASATS